MGRNRGDVIGSTRVEVTAKGPLDARCKVEFLSDLINEDTWKQSDGRVYLDSSLIVRVYNDPDTTKNGFYHLVSDNADYKVSSNWIKFGGGGLYQHGMGIDFRAEDYLFMVGEKIVLTSLSLYDGAVVEFRDMSNSSSSWTTIAPGNINVSLIPYLGKPILFRPVGAGNNCVAYFKLTKEL